MPKLKSKDEFIKDAVNKHGNKYIYDRAVYINSGTKIEIVCPVHGSFWITPASHSSTGRGCAECTGGTKYNQETFIAKAKTLFDKYDFSNTIYRGAFEKITVKCLEHGDFEIAACKILQKNGCPQCSKKKSRNARKDTTSLFIQKSIAIHGSKYDYSITNYDLSSKSVEIICKIHGKYAILPGNHINKGQGCPKCAINGKSKEEKEVVEYIKSIYNGTIIENDRNLISPKEIDILIPEKNFAIEYDGLYWHTESFVSKTHHIDKTEQCKEKGITLFHLFSDDWEYKKDIIKSMLKYRLGLETNKISARKCKIKTITNSEAVNFFEQNHLSRSC